MKTEKHIARLPSESLEVPEFYVKPGNPTTTIKKRKNKKNVMQRDTERRWPSTNQRDRPGTDP